MDRVFLCEKWVANGEYAERRHLSAWASLGDASIKVGRMLTVAEMKGTDAPNQWEVEVDAGNSMRVRSFRTGNWGYVEYRITELLISG